MMLVCSVYSQIFWASQKLRYKIICWDFLFYKQCSIFTQCIAIGQKYTGIVYLLSQILPFAPSLVMWGLHDEIKQIKYL